jgi:hypothetical protein
MGNVFWGVFWALVAHDVLLYVAKFIPALHHVLEHQ